MFLRRECGCVCILDFPGVDREPEIDVNPNKEKQKRGISVAQFVSILRDDSNLRMFVLARLSSQFGLMSIAFYTIYGVREFGMNEAVAGIMLSVMTIVETIVNPILGLSGDRWGHRRVFATGSLVMATSALTALAAPSLSWLYLAFALAGSDMAHSGRRLCQ